MVSLSQFANAAGPQQLFIANEESVVLQFLCEPKDFRYVVEHSNPSDWRKVAECTFFDGCWACEQESREYGQRVRVYMPVLVNGMTYIWSQPVGKGSGIQGALTYLKEHGTILDTLFEVTRTGSGKRTKYTTIPVDNGTPRVYTGNVSLSKVTKLVPYEKQANFYKKRNSE